MYFPDFVVPSTLATSAQFQTFLGESATLPTNADVLLREATRLVLEASEGAYYDVDTATGLATDTQAAKALADATCAQAAAWNIIGYDPLSGGVVTAKEVESKGIATARITYVGTADVAASKAAAANELVPSAIRILQANNLLGTSVWMFG
ncbi:hypothetical protein [Subtercola endophyticus]|uniref:hypothetical protein n=1 Tax=Subtercola endophyticus TaxID=2895559 RepID=UPI001E3E5221|nr:hypothetical protein [Subtercola endophyticus]UFS59476.1 hypothetical protein LQ955_01355 [Subtercola endophyticus]